MGSTDLEKRDQDPGWGTRTPGRRGGSARIGESASDYRSGPQLDELVGAYPNYNEEEEERRYYRRKRLGVVKNVLAASAGGMLTYGVYLGRAGRTNPLSLRHPASTPELGKRNLAASWPPSPFTSRVRTAVVTPCVWDREGVPQASVPTPQPENRCGWVGMVSCPPYPGPDEQRNGSLR